MRFGLLLADALRSLFRRPFTQLYPFERRPAPIRLRGALRWDRTACTGCQLCVKDCPANALELLTVDKAAKRFVLRYHADRCAYCAQCVQNCRFKCLSMSAEQWELASTAKEPFTVYYGDEQDVETFLGRVARPSVAGPAGE